MIAFLRNLFARPKIPKGTFLTLDFEESMRLSSVRGDGMTPCDLLYAMQLPTADEEAALERFRLQRTEVAFRDWIARCVRNRNGYPLFNTIGCELDGQSLDVLRRQPWVCGDINAEGRLIGDYRYLLRSLQALVQGGGQTEDGHEIWKICTITLGPVPHRLYDPRDPINLATREAARHGVTVVVAAGNEGRVIPGNSLNPWSVAPWVIGVGSAASDGSRLLRSTSRGDSPEQTPTVVAPGISELDWPHVDHGLDVALTFMSHAPTNSFNLCVVHGATLGIQKNGRNEIEIVIFSDAGQSAPMSADTLHSLLGPKFSVKSSRRATGSSFAAEYVSALCNLVFRRIRPMVRHLGGQDRPRLLKALLTDMARAVQNAPSCEAGAGFVSASMVDDYCTNLNEQRILSLLSAAQRW